MKYSILGFNQQKITEYSVDDLKCDLTDLMLLNYIVYAQANPKMKHILDDEEQPCVWLQHKHVLEDLPILQITEGTLKNRLTKLRKMKLVTSRTVANENTQGTRTYYRTTSFLHDMLYDTTSFLNDVVDEPRHSKMTSDTQVNKDKKVNSNSKELLPNSDFQFGKTKSKPKKDNLFTKCVSLIDSYDFVCWGNIRKLLIDYLNYRISVKDKPLYTNMWKGMLNKLCEMCDDNVDMYERVIKQSIERGYLSFYPISNFNNALQFESGARNVPVMTKEDYEREAQRLAELEAKGVQVKF